jgi:putative transposase
VIDVFTRECLEIEVGQNLNAEDVVRVLERLKFERGLPTRVYCDNGSEFVSGRMDQWAYSNAVKIEFSRLGKPTDSSDRKLQRTIPRRVSECSLVRITGRR